MSTTTSSINSSLPPVAYTKVSGFNEIGQLHQINTKLFEGKMQVRNNRKSKKKTSYRYFQHVPVMFYIPLVNNF